MFNRCLCLSFSACISTHRHPLSTLIPLRELSTVYVSHLYQRSFQYYCSHSRKQAAQVIACGPLQSTYHRSSGESPILKPQTQSTILGPYPNNRTTTKTWQCHVKASRHAILAVTVATHLPASRFIPGLSPLRIPEPTSTSTLTIHLGSQLSALITPVEIVNKALSTTATFGWSVGRAS